MTTQLAEPGTIGPCCHCQRETDRINTWIADYLCSECENSYFASLIEATADLLTGCNDEEADVQP